MMAFAFGPGSDVLICGTIIFSVLSAQCSVLRAQCLVLSAQCSVRRAQCFTVRRLSESLLPFPARAGGGVFEDDAAGVEVLSDPIRFREVARGAGGAALLDQVLDLLDRDGRAA